MNPIDNLKSENRSLKDAIKTLESNLSSLRQENLEACHNVTRELSAASGFLKLLIGHKELEEESRVTAILEIQRRNEEALKYVQLWLNVNC